MLRAINSDAKPGPMVRSPIERATRLATTASTIATTTMTPAWIHSALLSESSTSCSKSTGTGSTWAIR